MSLALLSCVSATAAENEEIISLGEGKLLLKAPEKWVRREPKVRIIEHEFAVEGKKGQDAGRVTVMGAGGTIEANIERWIISGTYKDMPAGPFAGGKAIDRKDYRMLAAIVPGGPNVGNYFIKFYGPAEVIKENEKAFHTMIESLQKK
jgi:hypothetical protein